MYNSTYLGAYKPHNCQSEYYCDYIAHTTYLYNSSVWYTCLWCKLRIDNALSPLLLVMFVHFARCGIECVREMVTALRFSKPGTIVHG